MMGKPGFSRELGILKAPGDPRLSPHDNTDGCVSDRTWRCCFLGEHSCNMRAVFSLHNAFSGVPAVVQQIKEPVLLQLWCGSQLYLGSDPWPRNFHMLPVQLKKKKKKLICFLSFYIMCFDIGVIIIFSIILDFEGSYLLVQTLLLFKLLISPISLILIQF